MSNQKITVYGAMWCPDTLRALHFLSEHNIEFAFKDIDSDIENTKFVEETNNGMRVIPTIILPNGSILVEPSNSEFERALTRLKTE
jgi:mycoredoxin